MSERAGVRPFRFGLVGSAAGRAEFLDMARRAEAVGYSTLLAPDHLGSPAPWPALAAASAVTERLRLGTFVLNNDLWHPLVLARDAATADVLSEGRLEVGLGAGHMEAEYRQAGLPFEPAARRIDRLAESVEILRGLFAGERVTFGGEHHRITEHELSPLPPQGRGLPILIGGNGDRLLRVAARRADMVGLVGFSPRQGGSQPTPTHFHEAGLGDRVSFVREAAGPRFAELELNLLVQRVLVSGDRRAEAERLASRGRLSADQLLASPFVLIGSREEMVERLRDLRERFHVSYFSVFDGRSRGFDPVVEQLAGR